MQLFLSDIKQIDGGLRWDEREEEGIIKGQEKMCRQ